jgi:hypothetical protein
MAEVLKIRVRRKDRPDYFETAGPAERDGMQELPPARKEDEGVRGAGRSRPVQKPSVVYLDFREELPAYDIQMHSRWRGGLRQRCRQEGSHSTAGEVRRSALESLRQSHYFYGVDRLLEAPVDFSDEELTAVSTIVGRDYARIRIVKHDYFNVVGYTAMLTTAHRHYSEAYAGSGDFAAIMMVRAISRAPGASLILLDEPETSLHPGAQKLGAPLAREVGDAAE